MLVCVVEIGWERVCDPERRLFTGKDRNEIRPSSVLVYIGHTLQHSTAEKYAMLKRRLSSDIGLGSIENVMSRKNQHATFPHPTSSLPKIFPCSTAWE